MNDGGPAYPLLKVEHDDYGIKLVIVDAGLSKLEWFAGMAMQGILSYSATTEGSCSMVTSNSFKFAQAMLAEAEKRRRDAK